MEYLTSEHRKNASQQGELLRKIAVSEEEIHAAERGSVHVPNAVIEYLNSTGVVYNTCENYLLRLVDEQKITRQHCLDILRNYPAAAYGVLMETKAKEDFFSFEREQWLPAMVPIFTHEQMRTILELKKSFSGSIAFYSEASFADRANYISLLHSQRDQLSRRHALLTETAKQIKRQIEDTEAFGYSESWKSDHQRLAEQYAQRISTLSEKRSSLEDERVQLQQEKRTLTAQLDDHRQALSAAENGLRLLRDIRTQMQREQDLTTQISDQKQQLTAAEGNLFQIEDSLSNLRRTEATLAQDIKATDALVTDLRRAQTETDGAAETHREEGDWKTLIYKFRQLLDTMSRELAGLRSQLQDKESRRFDYRKELDKRSIPQDLYAHVIHSEETENTLRKTVQNLDAEAAALQKVYTQTLEQKGIAKGQLDSAESKLAPFGPPLDKADVGANFEGRLLALRNTRKQVQTQKDVCFKRETDMATALGRLGDRLHGQVRPDSVPTVAIQDDYSAQCTSLADEMSRCRKQLAASEKQVSDKLSALRRQFQNTSCGVLDSVVSMTELLEKKVRGDRFFTLIDLIENSILNAQRAIAQICL